MLIECMEHKPLSIDGKAICKNVRINIANQHQLRAKLVYINDDKDIPIDIVIYDFSGLEFSLRSTSVKILVDGEEYVRHVNFKLELSYQILKKAWIINGTLGGEPLSLTVDKSSLSAAVAIIKEILKRKGEM